MSDFLTTAREKARLWREGQAPPVPDGVVLVLDGLFLGWAAELPPAELWVEGCMAIAGDGHVYLIGRPSWREPLQWFDLDPPPVDAADPPPSPPEPPEDPQPENTAAP